MQTGKGFQLRETIIISVEYKIGQVQPEISRNNNKAKKVGEGCLNFLSPSHEYRKMKKHACMQKVYQFLEEIILQLQIIVESLVRAHIPQFQSTGRLKNLHVCRKCTSLSKKLFSIGDDSGYFGEGPFCQLRERIILLSNISGQRSHQQNTVLSQLSCDARFTLIRSQLVKTSYNQSYLAVMSHKQS